MRNIVGDPGTEQWTITVKRDGVLVGEQKLHDPFLHNTTTIAISRWDLFKALFRKQFLTKIEVSLRATEGMQRRIMMMDPHEVAAESEAILEERKHPSVSNVMKFHSGN
jgi:hypothetical protein